MLILLLCIIIIIGVIIVSVIIVAIEVIIIVIVNANNKHNCMTNMIHNASIRCQVMALLIAYTEMVIVAFVYVGW